MSRPLANSQGWRRKVTLEVPGEIADWKNNTYASGPRKGTPKGRPPVTIISPFGIMLVLIDGEPVAYVSKKYAEAVRATIEREVSK